MTLSKDIDDIQAQIDMLERKQEQIFSLLESISLSLGLEPIQHYMSNQLPQEESTLSSQASPEIPGIQNVSPTPDSSATPEIQNIQRKHIIKVPSEQPKTVSLQSKTPEKSPQAPSTVRDTRYKRKLREPPQHISPPKTLKAVQTHPTQPKQAKRTRQSGGVPRTLKSQSPNEPGNMNIKQEEHDMKGFKTLKMTYSSDTRCIRMPEECGPYLSKLNPGKVKIFMNMKWPDDQLSNNSNYDYLSNYAQRLVEGLEIDSGFPEYSLGQWKDIPLELRIKACNELEMYADSLNIGINQCEDYWCAQFFLRCRWTIARTKAQRNYKKIKRSRRFKRSQKSQKSEKSERPERPERPERSERSERSERPERSERSERSESPDSSSSSVYEDCYDWDLDNNGSQQPEEYLHSSDSDFHSAPEDTKSNSDISIKDPDNKHIIKCESEEPISYEDYYLNLRKRPRLSKSK
ncbi:hypothetical protein CLU79DRAFT_779957 [Phycomyces nitens]|nr:hypothetical protein CLU79DRAFT_779957 [Phycomyces nitens]